MQPSMKPEEVNLVLERLLSPDGFKNSLRPLRMIRVYKEKPLDPKTTEKLLHEVVPYAKAGHNAALLSCAIIPKALMTVSWL